MSEFELVTTGPSMPPPAGQDRVEPQRELGRPVELRIHASSLLADLSRESAEAVIIMYLL